MIIVNITFDKEKLQKEKITNEKLDEMLSEYTDKIYNQILLYKFKVVSIYIKKNKINELKNNEFIKEINLNGEKRAI